MQICQSAQADCEFEQAAKATKKDVSVKRKNAHLFAIGFKKKLEQFWLTTQVLQTHLIEVDNPLTTREKVYKIANTFLISALRTICAGSDIGLTIGKEVLSHHDFEAFENAHQQFDKACLEELAHLIESANEMGEVAEKIPMLENCLHYLTNWPRDRFKEIAGYSYVNTNERIRNFNKSFDNEADFTNKVEALIQKILHLYELQFEKLTPKAAWLLGQACSLHLQRGLMLGLLKSKSFTSLEVDVFVDSAFEWLSYIPMEKPPKLKLTTDFVISADQFLRTTGLRCQEDQSKRDVYFNWDTTEIEALNPYHSYQYQRTFVYQYNQAMGYRVASEREVAHLQALLINHEKAPQLPVLLGNPNMPVAKMTWTINQEQIIFLQEIRVGAVRPIACENFVSVEDRLANLEIAFAALQEKVELINARNRALESENAALKNEKQKQEPKAEPKLRLF